MIKRPSSVELSHLLEQHELYINSGSMHGSRMEFFEGIDLSGLDLAGVNLMGAVLPSANLTLCKLTEAILGDVMLIGADLSGAIFNGAHLAKSELSDSKCHTTSFVGANLMRTDFYDIGALESQFDSTVQLKTSFLRAKLFNCSFRNVQFDSVSFSKAILKSINAENARGSLAAFVSYEIVDGRTNTISPSEIEKWWLAAGASSITTIPVRSV